jgi:hypothetical protein
MPLFLIVDVESILGEEEVWSRQARVTVRRGHNVWTDRWIVIKILQVFLYTLFHIVDVETILGEEEIWSSRARVTVRKRNNFWSDPSISI